MSGLLCQEPGCGGTIQDDYCDRCGTKAVSATPSRPNATTGSRPTQPLAPAAASGGAAAADTGADGSPCREPGCAGAIEAGYCNTCGTKASPGAASSVRASTASRPSQGLPSVRSSRSATSSTRRTTSTRTNSATLRRLGAGMVTVPPVPIEDPSKAVMRDPKVAEDKRFCAKCAEPVGRSRPDKPGRENGFCGKCGHPFNFAPKLQKGDMLGGQYEVAGCLAHGGLGWIYLAVDRNVSNRWVVLKGLLDSGDADALQAALAEQRFLASVEHPNIVKIYNVVQHEGAGYTVMEFVGGKSLKNILKDRREANGGQANPVPVEQAIAYLLELLPAFAYLHRLGLVYCDLKPDNLIQQGENLKLIDLGGVHRLGDQTSSIYGTVGFQAPEIAEMGPSVPSDLYTVARTLAVLCTDFRGYQGQYVHTLPPREDVPLYVEHDSLYRFLLKGTAEHPDDRFQSAEEMADQLLGVLRQIIAAKADNPAPAVSQVFTGDRAQLVADSEEQGVWQTLPLLRPHPDDPAAPALAAISSDAGVSIVDQLARIVPRTVEVELRAATEFLSAGDVAQAKGILDTISARDPWEWRVDWVRGLACLAQRDGAAAWSAFDRVAGDVPGELAPRYALAVAAEQAGQFEQAAALFEEVGRTDPSYQSASQSAARLWSMLGNPTAARRCLERIPKSSSVHSEAQLGVAEGLLAASSNGVSEAAVSQLAATLEDLSLDPRRQAEVESRVFERLLVLSEAKQLPVTNAKVFGYALDDRSLRLGLEKSYRSRARFAASRSERIRLVDAANAVRPVTTV